MKTAAITFGRFSPLTSGHLRLITELQEQQADDHFVYLSHSHDPKKNPLGYEDKLRFAREILSMRFPRIEVVESPANNILEALHELSGKYSDVVIVVGQDRIDEFTSLTAKYNGTPDKAGNILYSFSDISVISAGDRDPGAEGIEGMSASKLRACAAAGDYEGFAAGIPSDDDDLVREIYDAVRAGMSIQELRIARQAFLQERLKGDARDKANEDWNSFVKDSKSPKMSPDVARSVQAAFFKERDKNPKATPQEAYDNQPIAMTPDEEKKEAAESQEALKLVTKYKSTALGVVPPVPKTGGAISVLITGAAPPSSSLQKALRTFTPAVVYIPVYGDAVVPAETAATWLRQLRLVSKQVVILWGTPDQLVANLSEKGWKQALLLGNTTLASQYQSALKAASFGLVTQHPAIAEFSKLEEGKANPCWKALNDFDEPGNTKKVIAEVKAELKRTKADVTAWEIRAQWVLRRKAAFLEHLATGGSEGINNDIYRVFSALLEVKTGKSFSKMLKGLFGNEIEAVKSIGRATGITQAWDVAKAAHAGYNSGKAKLAMNSNPVSDLKQ